MLPYVFLLFILQQSVAWTSQRTLVLDEQSVKIQKKHPNISELDKYSLLLKHHLSPDIDGSPKYYRERLEDLKAMVQAYNLPAFFATFIADKVSLELFVLK